MQLSHGLSETSFCLLFSPSFGIGLSRTALHDDTSGAQCGVGISDLFSAQLQLLSVHQPRSQVDV